MSTDPSIRSDATNQPQEQGADTSRRERHRADRGGAWVGGAVLILLGMVFLMQNMGIALFDNWWAIFILLPALGAFGTAWNTYKQNGGQMAGAAVGSLVTGIVLTGLAVALFFEFDLSQVGPIALILIGVGVLASALMKSTT